MSRFHVILKSSFIAAILITCGCESDATHTPASEECTDACTIDSKRCSDTGVEVCAKLDDGCTNWKLDSKCETGTHCDENSLNCEEDASEPSECPVSCEEDSKRCSTDGIEICKKVDDNCFDWQLETPCEGDTHCDSDNLECIEDGESDPQIECPTPCTENAKQCGENGVEICTKQDNECLNWSIEKTCEEGTHCDAEQLDCVEGCTETCEDGKTIRCSDENELEECKPNASGCAEWTVLKECGDLSCDSEKADCIQNCTPACTKDEKKCDGNGIATCIDPANDGCTIWNAPVPCAANQSCEAGQCINKCTSNCTTEGATESTLTSLRTCKKTPEGCLQWEQTTTCNKGEKLNGTTCVKVCGSDCSSFSIVLLPDPQEYTRKVNDDGTKKSGTDDNPNPNVFADQLSWIAERKTNPDYNIKAVIHLGDVTDTNDPSAWKLVDKAYAKYFDTKENKDLPYILAPGNHDFLQCDSNDSKVDDCKYARKCKISKSGNFNADRFSGRKWFGGYYKTTNSYITFTAGGIDFLVIALEFAPRQEAIDWANKLIKDKEAERKAAGKPGYKVIIESHAYINPNSCQNNPNPNESGYYTSGYSAVSADTVTALDGNALNGKEMYKQLTSRHNNIILVINGHHSGTFFRLNKGKAGNVFGELAVDYQSENGYKKMHNSETRCGHSHNNGGSGIGFLRVLHFNPEKVTITAKTHSTLGKSRFYKEEKKMYCTDKYPSDFTIKPDYKITADGTHASTNFHSFTVTGLDFVTPVEYKYTE